MMLAMVAVTGWACQCPVQTEPGVPGAPSPALAPARDATAREIREAAEVTLVTVAEVRFSSDLAAGRLVQRATVRLAGRDGALRSAVPIETCRCSPRPDPAPVEAGATGVLLRRVDASLAWFPLASDCSVRPDHLRDDAEACARREPDPWVPRTLEP